MRVKFAILSDGAQQARSRLLSEHSRWPLRWCKGLAVAPGDSDESQVVLVPFAVFMFYHLFASTFPRLTDWAKYPSLRDPRGFGFDGWLLRWRNWLTVAPDRSTVGLVFLRVGCCLHACRIARPLYPEGTRGWIRDDAQAPCVGPRRSTVGWPLRWRKAWK